MCQEHNIPRRMLSYARTGASVSNRYIFDISRTADRVSTEIEHMFGYGRRHAIATDVKTILGRRTVAEKRGLDISRYTGK